MTRRILTTYIVTKPDTAARITFHRQPNLATDIPRDFAEPGETIIVTEKIVAEQERTVLSAVRTEHGFAVTHSEKKYDVVFELIVEEDKRGER